MEPDSVPPKDTVPNVHIFIVDTRKGNSKGFCPDKACFDRYIANVKDSLLHFGLMLRLTNKKAFVGLIELKENPKYAVQFPQV